MAVCLSIVRSWTLHLGHSFAANLSWKAFLCIMHQSEMFSLYWFQAQHWLQVSKHSWGATWRRSRESIIRELAPVAHPRCPSGTASLKMAIQLFPWPKKMHLRGSAPTRRSFGETCPLTWHVQKRLPAGRTALAC